MRTRIMHRVIVCAAAMIAVAAMSVLPVTAATKTATPVKTATGPTSHATYALGKAKKCKASFVKKTLTKTEAIKVKGKSTNVKIRYVGCVYVASKKVVTTTVTVVAPTPTTLPTAIVPTVSTTPVSSVSASTTPAPTITSPSTAVPPVALDPTCTQTGLETESCYFSVADSGQSVLQGGVLSLATTQVPNDQNALLAVPATSGCQINVTSTLSDSTCVMTYPLTGTYYVETLYQGGPGAYSASTVEPINVVPDHATTTTLSVVSTDTGVNLSAQLLTAYGSLAGSTLAFTVGAATLTPVAGSSSCSLTWTSPVIEVPPWSDYVPNIGWVTYGDGNPEPSGAILGVTNNPFYYRTIVSNCAITGYANIPDTLAINQDGTIQCIASGLSNDTDFSNSISTPLEIQN